MLLGDRLRKRLHRNLALAQDLIVMEVFDTFPGAVLHGGTAIWRCYKGNRFSDDIDIYLPPPFKSRLQDLVGNLLAKGLKKLKFKMTGSTVIGKFAYTDAIVSLECSLRAPKNHVVKPFEMLDGGFMLVNTLAPEDLLLEKVSAYRGRRKVRDLYDIFFLIQLTRPSGRIVESLGNLLKNFQRPVDESTLRAIIISGSVPRVNDMLGAIQEWAR